MPRESIGQCSRALRLGPLPPSDPRKKIAWLLCCDGRFWRRGVRGAGEPPAARLQLSARGKVRLSYGNSLRAGWCSSGRCFFRLTWLVPAGSVCASALLLASLARAP